METASDTVAVMVTHDGERYLERQWDSILRQTVLPAALVVVDDASHDRTREFLRERARTAPMPVQIIEADGSAIANPRTRIAANFGRGLTAAAGYDIVVLSDQDDEWLEDRVERQRAALRGSPRALLVAGDGILIDEEGTETGGLLSDAFPRPVGWETLDAAGRARAALRAPFVTGAASAMTRSLVELMSPVPAGWLHDRWATLVAVARDGLVLQDEPAIRYRLHGAQVLGQRQAQAGVGGRRWRQVLQRGSGPLDAASRAAQVVARVRPLATDPGVRRELSWRGVLASAVARA
jgi:glycosyltransferase involved in cell wall biosynthesis